MPADSTVVHRDCRAHWRQMFSSISEAIIWIAGAVEGGDPKCAANPPNEEE